MANKYYTIVVISDDDSKLDEIQEKAFVLGSTGIEEFSIDEPQVDAILGERSYSGADIPESVIDEVSAKASSNKIVFYFSDLENAKKFESFVQENQVSHLEIEEHLEQDWNAKWRESYQPIRISDELEVVPSWEQASCDKSLFIYPGMGFGTGNHETTFLCLKAFAEAAATIRPVNCLDFGCGSGILGLATYLYFPSIHVDFYDIDQAALDNTVQNVELNKFENKSYNLLLPGQRNLLLNKYDIVFANILKNVLEYEVDYLAHSVEKGGLLILSGLLNGQQDDILKLYAKSNSNLKCKSLEKKGDWVCIVFEVMK